ncbi:MAG: DNA-directed RNA polymerase subunit E'' [Nanoarchaeota archaeon]|nr:DNA-directed RNA polymerase subunit E'' [Nanoarchaeota archaeon]
MKKKVCKRCRIFYDTSECPICKSSVTAAVWRGRLFIADKDNSEIAKRVGLEHNGEYAIKVR